MLLQWTPSSLATFGASRSVLIRGVASFSGVDLYYEVVLDTGVASFQVS